MTVQVGAALGFLVIRRAGSIPGAVVGYSNLSPGRQFSRQGVEGPGASVDSYVLELPSYAP
jgi:hypothetical protein